jgi:hypothetical protein
MSTSKTQITLELAQSLYDYIIGTAREAADNFGGCIGDYNDGGQGLFDETEEYIKLKFDFPGSINKDDE